MKIPISVSIITFNEEKNIEKCLNSCKNFDDIIIVDSYSSDKTIEIAKKFNVRIFFNKFKDFSTQKNFALKKCRNKWILSIDADEIITNNLKKEIYKVITNNDDDINGYFIPRKTLFIKKWINYCGWYPDYILRLFKKNKAEFADVSVHEYVKLNGKTSKLKNPILHYSYLNLSDYFSKFNNYTSLAALQMKRKNKKFNVFMFIYKPFFKFIKMFFFQLGLKDGFYGLIVCLLGGIYTLVKYIKYWELFENEKN